MTEKPDAFIQADLRAVALARSTVPIPRGPYCYQVIKQIPDVDASRLPILSTRICPYWAGTAGKNDAIDTGYCTFTQTSDDDDKGTGLLWDQCKECGINEDDDWMENSTTDLDPNSADTSPALDEHVLAMLRAVRPQTPAQHLMHWMTHEQSRTPCLHISLPELRNIILWAKREFSRPPIAATRAHMEKQTLDAPIPNDRPSTEIPHVREGDPAHDQPKPQAA
jgi:hypothetical protein